MDSRSFFPSNYLKAADLGNREFTLLIRTVAMEDIGGDQKPILYFERTEKGLVLNKTNSTAIENAYGHDTDMWAGKAVVVFPATTMYQGQNVGCIRLRPHYPKANGGIGERPDTRDGSPTPAPVAGRTTPGDVALDDDIPF